MWLWRRVRISWAKVNGEDEVQNCLWNHEVLNLFTVGAKINYLMLCLHAELAWPNFCLHEISFKRSWSALAVDCFLGSVCLWQHFLSNSALSEGGGEVGWSQHCPVSCRQALPLQDVWGHGIMAPVSVRPFWLCLYPAVWISPGVHCTLVWPENGDPRVLPLCIALAC